jgi:threonine efflux protein
MSISQTILALVVAQLLIAMAPGPNTVLVMQYASRDRKLGFITALGIWPTGIFLASVGLGGLGSLLVMQPKLQTGLYFLCGSYLAWLGVKSIRHSFKDQRLSTHKSAKHMTGWSAFREGMVANITNPKTIAYWASIFTATGVQALPRTFQLVAVTTMPTISFLWNCLLVLLVSHKAVKKFLEKAQHWLDRIAGLVMIGFGVRLLTTLIT